MCGTSLQKAILKLDNTTPSNLLVKTIYKTVFKEISKTLCYSIRLQQTQGKWALVDRFAPETLNDMKVSAPDIQTYLKESKIRPFLG